MPPRASSFVAASFGPDVEWVNHLDYDVDPRRAESFYAAIRRYRPSLPRRPLVPAYAEIRPRTRAPAAPRRTSSTKAPPERLGSEPTPEVEL